MNTAKSLMLLVLLLSCFTAFSSPNKPARDSSLVLIPFDYKQSALYQRYTYEIIDSVVAILLKNDSVTLTIKGYAYEDEGDDSLCAVIARNRARFVKDYVLGRGVNSSQILIVQSFGKMKPHQRETDMMGRVRNCRVDILLNYPVPEALRVIPDRDGDGVADAADNCPDEFGYASKSGCPNKDLAVVPFEPQQTFLINASYKLLDSVITELKQHPSVTISIEGHAYGAEGINTVCNRLAKERAAIVKNYLLSRSIASSRIDLVEGYGNGRPINAGKNPMDVIRNSRAEIFFNRH